MLSKFEFYFGFDGASRCDGASIGSSQAAAYLFVRSCDGVFEIDVW